MANLTTEKGLVKWVPDATPISGHDVVVLRIKGTRRIFHSIVKQDDQPGLLSKLFHLHARFETYAVDLEPNQRLEVSLIGLESADHMGPFGLNLSIALQALNSRLLVERLGKDPLRRLEQEVHKYLGLAASRMDWSTIAAPESEFEDELLAAPVKDASGRRIPSLDYLQEYAKQLGLHLGSIQVSRLLPKDFGGETRVGIEEQSRQRILREQAETAEVERYLKSERELRDAEHKQALESINRLGEIRQGITDNLNKILAQIADKIESVPELRRLNEELSAIRQEIVTLPFLGGVASGNGTSREIKLVSGSSGSLLSSATQAPLSSLVSRAFLLLGELPCEPRDRDRLFSSILHLVGETALLDEADSAMIEEYSRRIREQARKVVTAVRTREQRALLRNLQKPEWVRAQLGPG